MKNFKLAVLLTLSVVFTLPNAHAIPGNSPIFHLKKIVGPYPELGTPESDRDFEILKYYQETRTEEDCEIAAREEKGTLKNLFGGPRGPLTNKEVKKFSLLLQKGKIASAVDHTVAKMIYKRPRPFLTDYGIKPCIKIPKSTAYPSGHSTISRVYARILSKMYPERADAFMARADEIAMHRVLGGVHHPSDTEAGKRLGDAIARKLLKTNQF